ncbi:DNA-binding protein [Cupriavidus basilensis]
MSVTHPSAELLTTIPPGLAAIANGRDALPTHEAAPVLNRKGQTMRKWACLECGPIRPVRINGRLAWRVADLARLLNGGA